MGDDDRSDASDWSGEDNTAWGSMWDKLADTGYRPSRRRRVSAQAAAGNTSTQQDSGFEWPFNSVEPPSREGSEVGSRGPSPLNLMPPAIEEALTILKQKHGERYTQKQFVAWATMLNAWTHQSYDEPPQLPVFQEGVVRPIARAAAPGGTKTRSQTPPLAPTGPNISVQVVPRRAHKTMSYSVADSRLNGNAVARQRLSENASPPLTEDLRAASVDVGQVLEVNSIDETIEEQREPRSQQPGSEASSDVLAQLHGRIADLESQVLALEKSNIVLRKEKLTVDDENISLTAKLDKALAAGRERERQASDKEQGLTKRIHALQGELNRLQLVIAEKVEFDIDQFRTEKLQLQGEIEHMKKEAMKEETEYRRVQTDLQGKIHQLELDKAGLQHSLREAKDREVLYREREQELAKVQHEKRQIESDFMQAASQVDKQNALQAEESARITRQCTRLDSELTIMKERYKVLEGKCTKLEQENISETRRANDAIAAKNAYADDRHIDSLMQYVHLIEKWEELIRDSSLAKHRPADEKVTPVSLMDVFTGKASPDDFADGIHLNPPGPGQIEELTPYAKNYSEVLEGVTHDIGASDQDRLWRNIPENLKPVGVALNHILKRLVDAQITVNAGYLFEMRLRHDVHFHNHMARQSRKERDKNARRVQVIEAENAQLVDKVRNLEACVRRQRLEQERADKTINAQQQQIAHVTSVSEEVRRYADQSRSMQRELGESGEHGVTFADGGRLSHPIGRALPMGSANGSFMQDQRMSLPVPVRRTHSDLSDPK